MGKKKSVVLMTLLTIVIVVLTAITAFPAISLPGNSVKKWNPAVLQYDLGMDLGGGYYAYYYPEGVITETEYNNNLLDKTEEEKAEYVVTYNANGGVIENATQTVVYGEEFTLAVPTKTGYIFKGWYVVDSEGEATSERLESGVWDYEGDVSVIAVWEEDPSSNGAYTDRY